MNQAYYCNKEQTFFTNMIRQKQKTIMAQSASPTSFGSQLICLE